MAAELKQQTGLDTELVVGDSGEFTVWLDGQKVAEKRLGRFPEPKDVVAAVNALRGSA